MTMAVIVCVLVTDYDGDIRRKWLQICTLNFLSVQHNNTVLALENVFTQAK